MTINYTTLLGLAEPVTGTESGTWGDDVNNGITVYVDVAIAGTNNITNDLDITLSITNGSSAGSNLVASPNSTTAQYMHLLCTGARTANRYINAPNSSKMFVVNNSTSGGYSIIVRGVTGPTTGVTIVNGEKAIIFWNSVAGDFVKISNTNGVATFSSITDTSLTSGRVTYAGTGGLLQDSANLTFTGTVLGLGAAGVGALFQGDFSNATFANRTSFQTSTTNATTGIYALPNGTSTAASWQAFNNSNPTNASKILIATNGSTDVQLVSGINGTGTYLPLSFYTNGSQQAQLDTSGNFTLSNGNIILTAGTANGVAYLNGSKVLTTGSALTFNGTTLTANTLNLTNALTTAYGGTGLSSYTAGDLPYYASGTTLSKLGIGTNGQILTSSGSAPQWSTLSGVAVTTFSAGTTGFTPSSATSGAITLAGTLATTNGGTGLTSFTANGVVYASSTSALTTGSALTFDGTDFTNGNGKVIATGDLRATTAGSGNVGLNLVRTGGTTADWYNYIPSGSADLAWFKGSEQMRLTSTGLGIGTSSPAYKLDVSGGIRSTLDASISGLTVGRGAGAVSTNTAVGYSALAANTSGSLNTAVGYQAGASNTTSAGLSLLGYQAGTAATGGNITAVGYQALLSNTSGLYNTAIGQLALNSNTTASNNTAVGYQAGYSNTTGSVTALGQKALYSNTTGADHVAVGIQSLYANTTGANNTAVGHVALTANTTGGANTALGNYALYSNTTASNNTAVGYQSLYANTAGIGMVAVGAYALNGNTTGLSNVAVGGNNGITAAALQTNTTGSYNTAIGISALASNTTASNNTAVGYQAAYYNTTGAQNVAIGTQALSSNTTGNNNVAIGHQALISNTTNGGNVAAGFWSLYNNTAANNTAYGYYSMLSNTTGTGNVAFGGNVSGGALRSNTTGSYNTAIGADALQSNTTASSNTAIGYQAGYSNATGAYGTYVGYIAGYNTVGAGGVSLNTFIGYGSGNLITSGTKNSILGAYNGNQGGLDIRTANNYIVLSDGDGNPRGIFDGSGNFLVGTTFAGTDKVRFASTGATSNQLGLVSTDDASGNGYIQFRNSATTSIGSITRVTTTNAVIYNTTSDYRLKNVIGAVTGQGERIDALKPIDYKWKDSGANARGFLAHEFQEVYENSVTGTKDAVDAKGNPVYQAMQPSTPEVIADLVAEIQSLRKRLANAGIA